MMKAKGTFYVPTLIAGWWIVQQVDQGKLLLTPTVVAKARAAWGSVWQTFNKAVNMGVRIGFGTAAGVYPHGMNATEFQLMVEHGMKPIDALRVATGADAELLGLADRIGTRSRRESWPTSSPCRAIRPRTSGGRPRSSSS